MMFLNQTFQVTTDSPAQYKHMATWDPLNLLNEKVGSVKKHGIGATLYTIRGRQLHLAGFFSSKLRKHQVTWLPCEIEALGIAAAVKHFSPLIIHSTTQDGQYPFQAVILGIENEIFSACPQILCQEKRELTKYCCHSSTTQDGQYPFQAVILGIENEAFSACPQMLCQEKRELTKYCCHSSTTQDGQYPFQAVILGIENEVFSACPQMLCQEKRELTKYCCHSSTTQDGQYPFQAVILGIENEIFSACPQMLCQEKRLKE
ncbi:hypothetical protein AC249_AIPGENE20250 [Exaiptasia diaphana]|nr:hypothetical protein AC249_AIPGENE20250 [Exaiptasia diaphana]